MEILLSRRSSVDKNTLNISKSHIPQLRGIWLFLNIFAGMFDILYQDEWFIAIDKPNGLLVHRSLLAHDESPFILQLLHDQIGKYLYPVHRLDRPTSGVLLFAFDKQTARLLSEQLISKTIRKEYIALVRGWVTEAILNERSVKNDRGNLQEASTLFTPITHYSLDLPLDEYAQQRYTLMSCRPHTGRWHQIRQHLSQLRHYIINDRVHGNNKHNKLFKETLRIEPFFLHAHQLHLIHPHTKKELHIEAPIPVHFTQFIQNEKTQTITNI